MAENCKTAHPEETAESDNNLLRSSGPAGNQLLNCEEAFVEYFILPGIIPVRPIRTYPSPSQEVHRRVCA